MKNYRVDLHVHTVLSPCADLLMTPGNIIEKALAENIDVLAITDHNSAENVKIAMELAKNTSLHIIPAMEVESIEEVHLLCYFQNINLLLDFQKEIYNALPDVENKEEVFGYQLLTDQNDEYKSKVNRLLATAVNLNIQDVIDKVLSRNGLVIPSHIDRSYGLITNLGFLPPEIELNIMEIGKNSKVSRVKEKFPFLQEHSLIKNSDSHHLNDLKPYMELKMNEVNLLELKKAFQIQEGRNYSFLN